MSGGKLLEGEEALTVSEGEVVSVLESVLNRPSLTPQCRNYALTALMKLSVRFSSQSERIKVSFQPCRLSQCLRQDYLSKVLPCVMSILASLTCSATSGKGSDRCSWPTASSPGSSSKA